MDRRIETAALCEKWVSYQSSGLRYEPFTLSRINKRKKSLMKSLQWLCLILAPLVISSCTAQSALSPSGMDNLASSSHVGCLSLIHGHSPTNGALENYLYLMIICQGERQSADSEFTSGVNGDPMSKAQLDYSWKTTTGQISVSITWNTASGDIFIGTTKFNLKSGNVFTIARLPDGKLRAQQCGTLGLHSNYKEALQFIRVHGNSDNVVRTAKFFGLDE